MSRTRSMPFAVAAVLALFAGAVPVWIWAGRQPGLPAIEDLGVLRADPHALDDGFTHIVVSVDGPAAPGDMRRFDVGAADGIDDVLLREAAAAGRIVSLEREPDGRIVAIVGGAGGGSGGLSLDALRAVPGTRSVTPVGTGAFAIVTTAAPDAYAAVSGVRRVTEDVPLGVNADAYFPLQWHLRNTGQIAAGRPGLPGADLGAEPAWQVRRGAGAVIAVVDGGVDVTHPDLQGAIWRNPDEVCGNGADDDGNGYTDDCDGWDFVRGDPSVHDEGTDERHATHIAGIVAARRDNGIGGAGLAPDATVMPIKVTDSLTMRVSDAARAIVYAVDEGATVVNCSWGTFDGTTREQVGVLEAAVEHARQRGVLIVAAAGNDGRDIDASPTYPASFPQDNVISVGATSNADEEATFSNHGAASVDVHAPGASIVSTVPGGYAAMSGTSMAAPSVSASLALIGGDDPAGALLAGAVPVPALAGRSASGARVDAGRVLNPSASHPIDPVRFAFDGFAPATAGRPISGAVRASVLDGVPSGVAFEATLLTAHEGKPHGVEGADVTTGSGTVTTGPDATVPLSGDPMPFGVTLPAGDYALVVAARDAGTLVGRPWAVFFTVAEAGQTAPTPVVAPVPAPVASVAPGAVPASSAPPSGPVASAPPRDGQVAMPRAPRTTAAPPAPSAAPSDGSAPSGGTSTGAGGTAPAPGGGTTTAPGGGIPTPAPSAVAVTTSPGATPAGPAPGGATPVPSAAPSGASGAPATPDPTARPAVTLPPEPAPVCRATLCVDAVTPRFGSALGGDVVVVTGRGFTPSTRVRFGSSAGSVIVDSKTSLTVITPVHAPGTDDVTVSRADGISVTQRQGYTFFGDEQVVDGAPQTPPGASEGGAIATPAPTDDPDGGDGAFGGDLPEEAPDRFTFGDVAATRDGLKLRPVTGTSPLRDYPVSSWQALRCASATCGGVRL